MTADDFPCCTIVEHESVVVDPLLVSRLRVARLLAAGPLTDEPGA